MVIIFYSSNIFTSSLFIQLHSLYSINSCTMLKYLNIGGCIIVQLLKIGSLTLISLSNCAFSTFLQAPQNTTRTVESPYNPDTRLVLENIDEEDKEVYLCSHSQKLDCCTYLVENEFVYICTCGCAQIAIQQPSLSLR